MKAAIMILFEDNGSFGADAGLKLESERIKSVLGERAVKVIPFSLEHSEEVKLALGNMVKFAAGRQNNGQGFNSVSEMEFNPEEEKFWSQVKRQLGPAIRKGLKELATHQIGEKKES